MIYLVAHIVFASVFVLTIKWVQLRRREDIVTAGAVNYIVAFALAMVLPDVAGAGWSVSGVEARWLGAAMGAGYFVCFFVVLYAIQWIGVSSASVVGSLAIIVPVLFGILLWGEEPDAVQVAGIVCALVALLAINRPRQAMGTARIGWWSPLVLVAFFALSGGSRLTQEAFKHLCQPAERPAFLLAAFLTAAVPSLILLVVRKRILLRSELGFGALMGVANVLQMYLILRALEHLEGYVVFPVAGAGSLILIALVARGLLGEPLTRRTLTAIALACLSLVLLKSQ